MRNIKKLLAAMLALTLLASTAGCSSPVKGTSEPSTETKANVAETAGQKASDDMTITEVKEPRRTLQWEEDVDYGIELYNEGDLEIACQSLGVGDASNICRLVIRVNENAKDQIFEWQDVRLSNESVPFTGDNPELSDRKSYLLKAGKFYMIDIYVDEDALNGESISDCEDIVIQAKYGDDSFEMTIPVAEVNERNGKGHEKAKTLFIEEQEAFNDKYAIVTVPEQNCDWHTDSWYVDFTVELKDTGADISEQAWGLAIREVYINEELIYTGEEHPNNNQCGPNNPYHMDIEIEKTELDILNNSTTEDSEISFNLIIANSEGETIEEITVTIPVTIKTDN